MTVVQTKRLYRSCNDKILGGVGGGIAEYFEVDPTLIRLAIAVAFVMGFGFLAYLLAWIIIPIDPSCEDGKSGVEEIKEQSEKIAQDFKNATKEDKESKETPAQPAGSKDFRFWFGLIIIFFALSLLFQNLFGYSLWQNFWPVILVAFGVVLITSSLERK